MDALGKHKLSVGIISWLQKATKPHLEVLEHGLTYVRTGSASEALGPH